MKNLITTLLVLLSLQLMAQDTLVHSQGNIEAVRILSLEKESNLIVYISSNDTIYSNLLNFDKIIVHTQLDGSYDTFMNTASISNSIGEFNIKRSRIHKYNYGQFSVSTNLTALIPLYLAGGRVTIEPEYRFNNFFSIKAPISIGIPRNSQVYYQSPGFTYTYTDYSTPPTITHLPSIFKSEDVIVQVGVSPKYYPMGKSKKYVTPYFGAAVNIGLIKYYGADYYVRSDTLGSYYNYTWDTGWNTTTESIIEKEGDRNYFNFELLLGLDFNFSKRLTATVETGYASRLQEQGVSTVVPRVYQRIGDGEYNLVNTQEAQNFYKRDNYYKFRILLTYHI